MAAPFGWIARHLKGDERWFFLTYALIVMGGILALVMWAAR